MVNKAFRIVLSTIFTISLLFVVPFNNIYADTISNSNVNINYYLDSVTEVSSGSYMQTYRVEFVFDQSYLGWISSKMVGTYISNNTVPITTSQFTKTQAIYVNGTIAETSFSFVTPNSQNGGALQSLSQNIQNSNVTPLADLSTLDDILNVLTDINNNIEIDVLDELQNIVANTSLANQYLEDISKIRQYDIPIESISVLWYSFKNNYSKIVDLFDVGYWNYPIFNYSANDIVFRGWMSSAYTYKFIFISYDRALTQSDINNYFNFNGGTFSNYEVLYYGYQYRIIKFDLNYSSNGFYDINVLYNLKSTPIYFGYNNNISTDFALQFGLSNNLLDNIQLIANGTNASSAASSQSDQANSQLQQDSNTLFTQEDSFKQNMNSAMQNIDTTFTLNNFGSSFMTSAQWVRTQYETLTNNTPFASLITFSLLVGLALIVIGKVYK